MSSVFCSAFGTSSLFSVENVQKILFAMTVRRLLRKNQQRFRYFVMVRSSQCLLTYHFQRNLNIIYVDPSGIFSYLIQKIYELQTD